MQVINQFLFFGGGTDTVNPQPVSDFYNYINSTVDTGIWLSGVRAYAAIINTDTTIVVAGGEVLDNRDVLHSIVCYFGHFQASIGVVLRRVRYLLTRRRL